MTHSKSFKNWFLINNWNEKGNISTIIFVSVNWRFPSYKIDEFAEICHAHNFFLIEDRAQLLRLGSYYWDGQNIGSKEISGSISFSVPRNIITGKGGNVVSNKRKF